MARVNLRFAAGQARSAVEASHVDAETSTGLAGAAILRLNGRDVTIGVDDPQPELVRSLSIQADAEFRDALAYVVAFINSRVDVVAVEITQ